MTNTMEQDLTKSARSLPELLIVFRDDIILKLKALQDFHQDSMCDCISMQPCNDFSTIQHWRRELDRTEAVLTEMGALI